MSGRPTADIEADLHHLANIHEGRVRHECLIEAADRLAGLDDEVTKLVDVIRLCRPYIMTDEHSEEADCDCDSMMDEVLKQYGVKRSDG